MVLGKYSVPLSAYQYLCLPDFLLTIGRAVPSLGPPRQGACLSALVEELCVCPGIVSQRCPFPVGALKAGNSF